MESENKSKQVVEKFKIGFFPGVWDLVHVGHIKALEEAKKQCDYLIVGINEDPSRDNPKKNKPILSVEERLMILKSLRYIDKVFVYYSEKELHAIDEHTFNIRFIGADHAEVHHKIGAQLIKISRDHNYSSSELRQRVYQAELARVKAEDYKKQCEAVLRVHKDS